MAAERALVRVVPYRLPFARPIATARGLFPVRAGYLVARRGEDGCLGYGDAAPWPGFTADLPRAEAALDRAAALGALPEADARGLLAGIVEAEQALDQARNDAAARRLGLPLAALGRAAGLGPPPGSVAVHALVNSPEEALAAVARGHRAVKMKVGHGHLAGDLERVAAVRAAVGGALPLRLDANGAWRGEAAIRACEALSAFGPDFIEQPADALETCARVRLATGVRVALDESIGDAASVEAALAADALDVCVLKPAFLPSRAAALSLVEACAAAGVEVVVTCALESAVGRAHALHLAAALAGRVDPLSGLLAPFASPEADVAGGLDASDVVDGRLPLPAGVGTGLRLSPAFADAFGPEFRPGPVDGRPRWAQP